MEYTGNIRRSPVKINCIGNFIVMYRARDADAGSGHLGFIDIFLSHLCQNCFADIRKNPGSVVFRVRPDLPLLKKCAICLK